MNYRTVYVIGSLTFTFAAALLSLPAGAQTINGISNATFTSNANTDGYDGQDATTHGVPVIDDSTGTLQLTTNQGYYDSSFPTFFGSENTSVYYNTQENVSNFTASFDYLYGGTNPQSFGPGNGFTFIVQDEGLSALGTSGFGNGQQGDYATISPSVALETNLFTGFGQLAGTGVAVDGDPGSSNPSFFTAPSGINLISGDFINYSLSYNGVDLSETLTDLSTSATFTDSYAVNIPTALGTDNAYVGFTGGTGAAVANQFISNFSFTSGNAPAAPAPESSTLIGFSLMAILGAGALIVKKVKASAS